MSPRIIRPSGSSPRRHTFIPSRRRAAGILAMLAAGTGLGLAAAPAQAQSGHTYYVSPSGSDNAAGTTPSTAWRSLAKASSARLSPGDSLLLERGGTWSGALRITDSGTSSAPITVGAYGSGALPRIAGGPCVTLSGSWVVASQLAAVGCSYAGFSVFGDHVGIRQSLASHNVVGIEIDYSAAAARVVRNRLIDNNRLAPNTPGDNDDHGAQGIAVLGDRARVGWNLISGSHTASPDYGQDGAAVEVYGSTGSYIHHNVSIDNLTFTELGNKATSDTTFAYNVVRSSLQDAGFIVTRGAGDYWGPVKRTVASHNTVRLTGSGTQTFWCGGTCGPSILSLSDNVLVSQARIGYAPADSTGYGIGGGGNLYWGSVVEHRKRPGDIVANPHFASGSLQLSPGSPAVDRIATSSARRPVGVPAWSRDAAGRSLPVDGDGDGRVRLDLGALEYHP